jgi:hypothetical protein
MEGITFLDENTPDLIQDPLALPSLEGAMNGTVVAELPWQMVPLAARARTIDDAIERLALVDS